MVAVTFTLVFTGTAATETMGQTALLTTPDNGNGNLLIAQPATLALPGTLQSMSFNVTGVGGQLVLGVYSNNAGAPGALLAQTAVFTPVVGWNTRPTTLTPMLAAGTYWLAYWPASSALAFLKKDGGVPNASFTMAAFSSVMPATFPVVGVTQVATVWNLYATLGLGPPPPPTNYVTAAGAIYTTEDGVTAYMTES